MPPLFIPATFASKKAKILQDLSVPASEYRDKSPKGSVDEGIRELIDEINACDGLVTTSSCAGRISLFLEGNGKVAGLDREKDEIAGSKVPGGKGGGEFLFVSHDPVNVSEGGVLHQLHKILDLSDSFDERRYGIEVRFRDPDQRFVRLAFEPMVRRRSLSEVGRES